VLQTKKRKLRTSR